MKPRLAILVGHHGKGTGCSYGNRDEYELARRDANALFDALMATDTIIPMLEPIEIRGDAHPISTAAWWAKRNGASAVVEIHYNALDKPDTTVSGNLIIVKQADLYASTIDHWLAMLPNHHREPIISQHMALLNMFPDGFPVVIVEAAFIWEPGIEESGWSAQVAVLLAKALKQYFEQLPTTVPTGDTAGPTVAQKRDPITGKTVLVTPKPPMPPIISVWQWLKIFLKLRKWFKGGDPVQSGITSSSFIAMLVAYAFTMAIGKGWIPAGDYKDKIEGVSVVISGLVTWAYMHYRNDYKKTILTVNAANGKGKTEAASCAPDGGTK